jgi:hypothetical protein
MVATPCVVTISSSIPAMALEDVSRIAHHEDGLAMHSMRAWLWKRNIENRLFFKAGDGSGRVGRAFPPPALERNGPRAPETIKMGIAPPFPAGRHSGITIILSAGRRSTGPTSTAPSRLAGKPAQSRRNSYDIMCMMQDGSRVAQELIGPAGIRCVVGCAGYRANPHHEVDLRASPLPATPPPTA